MLVSMATQTVFILFRRKFVSTCRVDYWFFLVKSVSPNWKNLLFTHLKFSQYEQNLTTKFLLSLDFFRTIYDCLKWFTLRYNTIKLFFILSHALLSNKHLVIYDCTVYAMHSICLAFSMCSFVIRFYFFLYPKN